MHLFSIKQPFTKRFPSPRRRCLVHAQVPTPCLFSRINTRQHLLLCVLLTSASGRGVLKLFLPSFNLNFDLNGMEIRYI